MRREKLYLNDIVEVADAIRTTRFTTIGHAVQPI